MLVLRAPIGPVSALCLVLANERFTPPLPPLKTSTTIHFLADLLDDTRQGKQIPWAYREIFVGAPYDDLTGSEESLAFDMAV